MERRKNRFYKSLLTCLFLLFIFLNLNAQYIISKFTYSISINCRASAGVFDAQGNLVRTLWNNRKISPGTYTEYWDRKDDKGQLMTGMEYHIRIVSNNIRYQWEGVIGNNSDSSIGSSRIRAFNRFNSMSVFGNFAYYSIGYSEGMPSSYKLDLRHPKNKINILNDGNNNTDLQCDYVCTDGSLVYWGGFDPFDPGTSFIFATNCIDDKEYKFNSGKTRSTIYGRTYQSVIRLKTSNLLGHPSGLAVQKQGSILAIAYKDENSLILCDKYTGDSVSQISITQPREITFDQNGNLWIISEDNKVCRYPIKNGQIGQANKCIGGLEEPLALAVSSDNRILVTDGGSSQQIKFFDTSGTIIKTIGSEGGYRNDPMVNNYKFYFSDTVNELTKPFAAFEPDNSFWIGDVGNERVMHYDSNGVYLDHIMCMPHSYSIAADKNDPTRVFNELLEFSVDYSKPLSASNGSWTLVRNWRAGMRKAYYQRDKFRLLNQIGTLSNGRTYAFMDSFSNTTRIPVLVELPDTGQIRYSDIRLDEFALDIMESNGDLRKISSTYNIGDSGWIISRKLSGFQNGWPRWNSEDTLATLPVIDKRSPACYGLQSPAVCNNINILFNAGKENGGFHLAGLKNGDRRFQWIASPSTTRQYTGPMPEDGRFDIGNNVEYPGGRVLGMDSTFFWNYHGEFWKNSQTNIWNHFHSSGLMLAQFGITTPDGEQIRKEAFPQGAGNVFSTAAVKVGTNIYIYHNDESVHGGVHRWKVSGLNSIQVQTVKIENINTKKGGLDGKYFKGGQLDPIQLKWTRIERTVDNLRLPETLKGETIYCFALSGYILSDTASEFEIEIRHGGKLKFVMNGELVIFSPVSGNDKYKFRFENGGIYPIRIESNDVNIQMLWNRTGAMRIIPEGNLLPEIHQPETGVDLMYGLTAGNDLQNGQYGWSYSPQLGAQNRTAQIGVKLNQIDQVDISASNFNNDTVFKIQRNLKGIELCTDEWTLEGTINYEKSNPESMVGGLSIRVRDSSDRILAELRYEILNLPEYEFPSSLKCNGEPVVSGRYTYIQNSLSGNRKFNLTFGSNGITFKLDDLVPLNVKYPDINADWHAPGKLEIEFAKTIDEQARTVSIGALKITGSSHLNLINLGQDTVCPGSTTYLLSLNPYTVVWNNNSTDNPLMTEKPGKYYIKYIEGSKCRVESDTAIISVDNMNAVIFRNGDRLIADTADQYKWILDGQTVSDKKTLRMSKTGLYKLICKSRFGCTDSATLNVDRLGIDKNTVNDMILYPNPVFSGQSLGYYSVEFKEFLKVEIYGMDGIKVIQLEIQSEEQVQVNLKPGVYLVKLIHPVRVWEQKLIVL